MKRQWGNYEGRMCQTNANGNTIINCRRIERMKVSTRCRGRSPLFSRNFFSSARRKFPRFPRSSRLSAERDGRENVRLSCGRVKKPADDTTDDTTLRESKWEMCEITDYYDLARVRNQHLRAVVIITETHDSVYRVYFVRLAQRQSNCVWSTSCD